MSHVNVKVHPPSGTIVLDRPEQRNALDRRMLGELSEALSDLHQEKKVRAVVLTGAGADFSAGVDLVELHATAGRPESEALPQWHEDWARLKDLLEQMLRYPKPLIAAVDGVALGGGMGLALACDLVVASSRATFGVPAVRRGLISGSVAPLLAFRAGGGTAAWLLLTGASIDAETAARRGLVHELAEPDQIWVRAHELAVQCAAAPAEALQLTKRLLNETIGESLVTQLSVAAAMGATACTTEAAAEGLAAFVEKREPEWP